MFFLWVGLINKLCVMAVFKFLLCLCLIFFLNFNLVFIYIYIYILVSGNILNKSLFMQVEIAKNLLLFNETITILFI